MVRKRLLNEFSTCLLLPKADGILDALWQAILAFGDGGPQSDDTPAALALYPVGEKPAEGLQA